VRITGLFSTAAIERLLSTVERLIATQPLDAGTRTTTFVATDGTLSPRKLTAPFFLDEAFRRIALDPRLADTLAMLGSGEPLLVMDHVFLKPPHQPQVKYPHQDNSYFGVTPPERVVTAWIALDDADTENGCLYYLSGSQRLGLLEHAAPPEEPRNFKVEETSISGFTPTHVPARRGDVIFHQGYVVHGSGPNRSGRWRRAYATHWIAAPANVPEALMHTAAYLRPDYPGRDGCRARFPAMFPAAET